MIYLGADHRGFKLKEGLKLFLAAIGYQFEDLGPFSLNPDDDFPDYAFPVADKVAADPERNLGILMCSSGNGEVIAANKVKGVRAALGWTPEVAKFARQDDFTNVLALPAEYISEGEAQAIVKTWLETQPSSEPRFKRRIDEIAARER